MSCSICIEEFNKSSRNRVHCQVCKVVTCSTCVETYLLSTLDDAHCMSCRAAWTREMMDSSGLSKKFVNDTFKKRREVVLFERERAQMPATQPLVEKEVLIRKAAKQIIEIEEKMREVTSNAYRYRNSTTLEQVAVEIQTDDYIKCLVQKEENFFKIMEETFILSWKKNKLESIISRLTHSVIDVKKEARKFIRACPHNGCNGFLSHVWHCGVCDRWTCNQCHEIKEDNHVCNPSTVETVKLLSRDTKPCPKCASMIFKIEGCDQMWCTQCSTAFSWRTGQVEHGRIHNPHYYEYQRNHGSLPREIGDIPCGGMPSDTQVREHFKKFNTIPPLFYMNVIRLHWHIFNVVIPQHTRQFANNQDLRIKFMMHDIDENVFKKKIQQREKSNQKHTEITNVLNTYQLISSEIMQRMLACKNEQDSINISLEFDELRSFINGLMKNISRRYICVVPFFNDTFVIQSLKI